MTPALPTHTDYIALTFAADLEQQAIIIALLAELGFEGFEEYDQVLKAYIPVADYDREQTQATLANLPEVEITEEGLVPDTNWNEQWERAYDPIYVDDYCQILAAFHTEQPGFAHTLYITPQMSFGTGHHPTTRLMIRHMKELDWPGRSVLDMGCGTGVLAILARKLGAAPVVGIDIDRWSADNATENATLNQQDSIEWIQGDREQIPPRSYAIILANINRNILLADIPAYLDHLDPGGELVMSGFFPPDIPALEARLSPAQMEQIAVLQEGEWAAVRWRKPR
jgi:ribosomal protein L11 methyltransferase